MGTWIAEVRDRERNAADSEVCAWTREGNAGCKEQIAPGKKDETARMES